MSNDESSNGPGAPEGNDHAVGNSGGGAPTGPDNGSWTHGVYSDYLRPKDQDMMEELSGSDPEDHLEFLIDFNVMRILRAAEEIGDPEMIVKALDDDTDIEELNMKDEALARRSNEVRRMIRDFNEMTEGKDINLNEKVSVDDLGELDDEEQDQLEAAFDS